MFQQHIDIVPPDGTTYAEVRPAKMRPSPFIVATLPQVVNDNWFEHINFDTDEARARFFEIAAYLDPREALAESIERMEAAREKFSGTYIEKTRRAVKFVGQGFRVLGGKRIGGPGAEKRRAKRDNEWAAEQVSRKAARRDIKGFEYDLYNDSRLDSGENDEDELILANTNDRSEHQAEGDVSNCTEIPPGDGEDAEEALALCFIAALSECLVFDPSAKPAILYAEIVQVTVDHRTDTIVVVLKDGRTITYTDDEPNFFIVINDEPNDQIDEESPDDQIASVMSQMMARVGNPARSTVGFDPDHPDHIRYVATTRPVCGIMPGVPPLG
jgi:hypothetical protein